MRGVFPPRLGDTSQDMVSTRTCINSAVAAILSVTCALGPVAADPRADELLAQLAQATPENAPYIEEKLMDHWSQSGSPAMDLLLRRGRDSLAAGDTAAAIGHFTALIDHAPDFTQAYVDRAEAYLTAELTGPALADIRQALVNEPRHVAALAGLAVLLNDIGSQDKARAVLAELKRIHPNSEDAALIEQLFDDQTGAIDA